MVSRVIDMARKVHGVVQDPNRLQHISHGPNDQDMPGSRDPAPLRNALAAVPDRVEEDSGWQIGARTNAWPPRVHPQVTQSRAQQESIAISDDSPERRLAFFEDTVQIAPGARRDLQIDHRGSRRPRAASHASS